jgi:GR25 family glycosyltransferase involved in LPS biosynthesis
MTDNIINSKIDFYCLNFQNENNRRQRMNKKSIYFQIPFRFYSGVTKIDPRISFIEDENIRRSASICYGHLDMMNHFVKNSSKEFVVIMEDDIIIRKTFCDDIIKSLDIFIKYNYDILLLGYLCHNPIDTYSNFYQLPTEHSSEEFKIIDDYPNDCWGAQMYMLSKSQCKELLSKYSVGYFERTLYDSTLLPFSADWTITKEGKRCLLYPQRAAEEYIENQYQDEGQSVCRYNCNQFIKKEDYI